MIVFEPSDFEIQDVKDNRGYKVTIKLSDKFDQLVKSNGILPSKEGVQKTLSRKTKSNASIDSINKTITLNYGRDLKDLAMTDFSQTCADAANQCVRNIVQSMESYATVIGTTIKPNKPK